MSQKKVLAVVGSLDYVNQKNELFHNYLKDNDKTYKADRWSNVFTVGSKYGIYYDERMKDCYGLKTYVPADLTEFFKGTRSFEP